MLQCNQTKMPSGWPLVLSRYRLGLVSCRCSVWPVVTQSAGCLGCRQQHKLLFISPWWANLSTKCVYSWVQNKSRTTPQKHKSGVRPLTKVKCHIDTINNSDRMLEIHITRNDRRIKRPNYWMRWLVLCIVGGVYGQNGIVKNCPRRWLDGRKDDHC